MVVLLMTLTFVAGVRPILTVAPETKLLPLIVTDVPPSVGPEFGVMPDTLGAGSGAAAYV